MYHLPYYMILLVEGRLHADLGLQNLEIHFFLDIQIFVFLSFRAFMRVQQQQSGVTLQSTIPSLSDLVSLTGAAALLMEWRSKEISQTKSDEHIYSLNDKK
jgi:hypothetical protein